MSVKIQQYNDSSSKKCSINELVIEHCVGEMNRHLKSSLRSIFSKRCQHDNKLNFQTIKHRKVSSQSPRILKIEESWQEVLQGEVLKDYFGHLIAFLQNVSTYNHHT